MRRAARAAGRREKMKHKCHPGRQRRNRMNRPRGAAREMKKKKRKSNLRKDKGQRRNRRENSQRKRGCPPRMMTQRRNKRGKIEDEDSIYVGYATKPRSGGYDRGRLFPSNKTIRASTAPSGLRVRHYKKWDRRFGTSNVIRSSDNRFLSTIESRRRRRERSSQSRDLRTIRA